MKHRALAVGLILWTGLWMYGCSSQPTHVAGLRHGMSWTEMLINLGELPPRGAYFQSLPIKVADQSGSPARAIAFVPQEQ